MLINERSRGTGINNWLALKEILVPGTIHDIEEPKRLITFPHTL